MQDIEDTIKSLALMIDKKKEDHNHQYIQD